MRALTVQPMTADSARVGDHPDPEPADGDLLVRGLALGVCGTDREIVRGEYGWAPPGHDRLVLGHESLGRVERAPAGSGFTEGDLVVGVVRRPDPVPCGACAHGEFDMCRNGRYTERGIKEIDGFGSELWTAETDYTVKLDPSLGDLGVLMEPTSVVAKAWDQIEKVGARAYFEPERVLVTGAGPIGLLAALLGAQRGLDVHVLDIVDGGPKPQAVAALGAQYHNRPLLEVAEKIKPDIIVEATGVGRLVADTLVGTEAYGIVCLTGVSTGGHKIDIDAGAANREIVLENDVIVGSVNANVHHFQLAADALAAADRTWLQSLITRRVPLAEFETALTAQDGDIKVVLTLDD